MGQRGVSYVAREFDRDELISRLETALAETVAATAPGVPTSGSRQVEGRPRPWAALMVERTTTAGSILMTGATGFIGGHMSRDCRPPEMDIRPLPRIALDRIGAGDNEAATLRGCIGVVHPRRALT